MINWHETPFIRLLLPFLIGIITAIYIDSELPFLTGFLIILPLFYFGLLQKKGWYKYQWIYALVLNLFLLLLGYQITQHNNELNCSEHFQKYLQEENWVLGKIVEMPIQKKWLRVEVEVLGITRSSDSLKEVCGKLLLYVEKDSLAKNLKYGDVLAFRGKLSKIEPPKNPYAFDYRSYLHFQNIHFQAFIKNNAWQKTEAYAGNIILKTALELRTKFIEILRHYLPSEHTFSVGSALILGYKDEISEEIRTAYAGTGAMHVLAVSGLHVGIIYLIFNSLFIRWIYAKSLFWKITKVAIPILAIWSFALLTGMSPSVQRAATMFTFIIFGRAWNQHTNIYNILAASAFCLLLFNPFLIMNVGFQLSYLAVIGIVYFQPKIASWWQIKNAVGNWFWQLACVSVAAQITTLPLGLFYFHQIPWMFWLSGLIVVPAAFLILSTGILLFVLETIQLGLGSWLGTLLNYLLEGVNWCVFMIQGLPWSLTTGIWISLGITILLYILVVNLILLLNTKKFKWVLGILGISVTISISYAFSEWANIQQRKIVIYNVYKNSVIDFMNGTHIYSFVNQGISKKNIDFSSQNNRWAAGMENLEVFYFEDNATYLFDHLLYKNGFVQFYDKKLAIISETLQAPPKTRIKVQYALVRNNPKIEISRLLQHFDFEQVIFDASNSRWKLENWKLECKALGINFYDVNEAGAWELSF